jgi:5'(3')-deoxyribonucleotidase
MLELVDMLNAKLRYTGDTIYILTSLSDNGMIFNEHLHDKIVSFHEWFPYIDIDHVLISTGPKRDTVEYITNHVIKSNDILIDDYNKNLEEWRAAGGTSVKYCNGINNPNSFDGQKIGHYSSDASQMLNILMSL